MNVITDEKCAFNIIYKFDRHYTVNGTQICDIRDSISFHIAENIKELGVDYDIISPIPNTGFYYAESVAKYLDCEYKVIFEKKSACRTLGKFREDRVREYKNLLMHVDAVPTDARVLFIDEAMLSGLTVDVISNACIENNIKNYSFAFASPVIHCHCPWGHIKNTNRYFSELTRMDYLIQGGYEKTLKKLKNQTHTENLLFMPISRFVSAIDPSEICNLCFFEGV